MTLWRHCGLKVKASECFRHRAKRREHHMVYRFGWDNMSLKKCDRSKMFGQRSSLWSNGTQELPGAATSPAFLSCYQVCWSSATAKAQRTGSSSCLNQQTNKEPCTSCHDGEIFHANLQHFLASCFFFLTEKCLMRRGQLFITFCNISKIWLNCLWSTVWPRRAASLVSAENKNTAGGNTLGGFLQILSW